MPLFQNKQWDKPKQWFRRLAGREAPPTALSRIETWLDERGISYRLRLHPDTFKASDLAESLHITGKRVAKVVIVRARGRYMMAVLPSHLHISLERLARQLKVSHLSLATEAELKALFPDCEIGAMPPLGNLYGLPVYVDLSLTHQPVIYFAAGTHHHVIEMRYRNFEQLVKPEIRVFATAPTGWAIAI
jgi:Ala-tRNA(Pro) deacylase